MKLLVHRTLFDETLEQIKLELFENIETPICIQYAIRGIIARDT